MASLRRGPGSKFGLPGNIVQTSYTSADLNISEDFLAPLQDPSVIKSEAINFANTPLPEYAPLYAVVLDNVLSPEECMQLILLAELSAGGTEENGNGWIPAMVNAGPGHEFLARDYRNSDRIIWDQKVVVKRLWERVLQVDGVREYLGKLEGPDYDFVTGHWGAVESGERWVATKQGINERMRFLKYGPGQFFRRHCDGHYETPDGSQRSFFTLHLYLNDSVAGFAEVEEAGGKFPDDGQLRGGATTFHSRNGKHRYDVDPKAGRVLIFQHAKLLHSGDDVISGTKYTMRSDLMYEFEGGADGSSECS